MEPHIKEKPASKGKEKQKEPEQYKVIILNDHFTTMGFVVEVLMAIFHKNEETAYRIMMDVHRKGKGVVGVYTWDIAATKTEQVHEAARVNEFPLRCIIEPV
ncbi:MAG: ATP-dependent Clp protease adaptor ClpS [Treponema sp.]|nr:ATP-dependent Clp protease adaptor ClpS [Treponema sp.]